MIPLRYYIKHSVYRSSKKRYYKHISITWITNRITWLHGRLKSKQGGRTWGKR